MTPNSAVHQKYSAILETLARPLGPDTLSRIRNQLVEADQLPQAFIAVYSPATLACFTMTLESGHVMGWTIFGAKDAASAMHGAQALHRLAEEALTTEVLDAAGEASSAIQNARRH